jgi:hypothetical protein
MAVAVEAVVRAVARTRCRPLRGRIAWVDTVAEQVQAARAVAEVPAALREAALSESSSSVQRLS